TLLEDQSVFVPVTANDHDVEDGFFPGSGITIVEAPEHGSVEVLPDGRIRYTPETDYVGQDQFTYTLTDSEGAVSQPATVTLTVTPVNDAPKAKAGVTPALTEDAATVFNAADYFYDPEGDDFTVTAAS